MAKKQKSPGHIQLARAFYLQYIFQVRAWTKPIYIFQRAPNSLRGPLKQ